MKPNPKVPQLWARNSNFTGFNNKGVDLRIVYPNGYVETNTFNLEWGESFLSSATYKLSVAQLIDYGHTFLFNIE